MSSIPARLGEQRHRQMPEAAGADRREGDAPGFALAAAITSASDCHGRDGWVARM